MQGYRRGLAIAVGTASYAVQVSAKQVDEPIRLAGQVELARLLDLAASELDLNIVYDPLLVQGSFAVRVESGLSDQELWAVTNQFLANRGLTTVQLDGSNTIGVVKVSEAAGVQALAIPGQTTVFESEFQAATASVVYRCQNITAAALLQSIQPLLSRQGGSATAIGESGLILIVDNRSRLARIEEYVALLDVPPEQVGVSEYRPQQASPQWIVTAAQQLAAMRESAGAAKLTGGVAVSPSGTGVMIVAPPVSAQVWRDILLQVDQAEPVAVRVYEPQTFALEEVAAQITDTRPETTTFRTVPWKIVQDRLTGTLVVTATASEHDRIAALMERLAATPPAARRGTRAFQIRHRPVSEVVGVLQGLLMAGAVEAGLSDRMLDGSSLQIQSGQPPTVAPSAGADAGRVLPTRTPPSSEGVVPDSGSAVDLRMTTDEATNTLIVVGEPRVIEQVGQLLESIDVRQPQVMIEVTLVSLSDSEALNLGIELSDLIESGATRIRLLSLFGLSTVADGLAGGGNGGAGGTGIILSPGDYAMVIRALETLNSGRSLSSPRLLIGNGQEANLNSTLGQPVTSVNASDTVATTSFAGFSDAGTQVAIRPQIAAGDHLLLDYSITLSAFVGPSPGPGIPPARQQNQLQSIVTIPDGYTVVIGGIDLLTESDSENRVPLLGAIPGIGELFKNRNRSDSRQRFFAFIRAEVDRGQSFDYLRHASDGAAQDAGIPDGWPRIAPVVMP